MQAALVLMTILGCDDSASQCHYVATAEPRWATVALCDAASESQLSKYGNISYPTVVAVCQAPETTASASVPREKADIADAGPAAALPVPDAVPEVPEDAEKPGLAARAISRVKNSLPTAAGMKAAVRTPLHFAGESYSWLARKIGD